MLPADHYIPAVIEWKWKTTLYDEEAIHQTPIGQGAGNCILLHGHHHLLLEDSCVSGVKVGRDHDVLLLDVVVVSGI